jgi:hypothetical protein
MFELKGFDELKKALTRMGDMAIPKITAAVDKANALVMSRAQARAKGNLKNCLELKKATVSNGVISGRLKIKSGFGYAVPYELGHRLYAWGRKTNTYIAARPFIRPAFDESREDIGRIADAAMDEILKEFGK